MFSEFKGTPIIFDINYKLIPTNLININPEGAKKWNSILDSLYNNKDLERIKRTTSGGISWNTPLPAFDVRKTTNCIEITYLGMEGMYRIQFRSKESVQKDENSDVMTGSKAFKIFRKLCVKHGVNIDAMAIENGPEVKASIPKVPIMVFSEELKDQEISPAFHIDLNSSYCSGIAKAFPELAPVMEELYNNRKVNPVYKSVLTHLQGYMQSLSCCGAKWAHIAKAGIEFNNEMIKKLATKLIEAGKIILTFNTDGIWYTSDDGRPYEDEEQGTQLGQYKNDHKYCRFRFKSAGSYEFMEKEIVNVNGQNYEKWNYHPVVRGQTKLDLIKPRSEWGWGDIYQENAQNIISFRSDAKGYIYNENLIKY